MLDNLETILLLVLQCIVCVYFLTKICKCNHFLFVVIVFLRKIIVFLCKSRNFALVRV